MNGVGVIRGLLSSSFLCWLFVFIDAAERINVGIIDYPDRRWKKIARETVAIRAFPMDVKDMSFREPVTIKNALEVEQFIKREDLSVLIGRDHAVITTMASELNIPYIITEENHVLADVTVFEEPEMVMTMYPGPNAVKKLVSDLMLFYNLKDLYIIYDAESGHSLMGYLLSQSSISIRTLQIGPTTTDDEMTKEMIHFRNLGRKNIMLLIHPNNVPRVLDVALKISLLIPDYHWIVVTLDAGLIDFTPWVDSGLNVTMFQLAQEETDGKKISLQDALFVDALSLVAEAVKKVGQRGKRAVTGLKAIIQKLKFRGLTGSIEFDKKGFRKNLILDMMGVGHGSKGMYQKGVWIEKGKEVGHRIRMYPRAVLPGSDKETSALWPLGQRPVRVVSILEEPFLMLKKPSQGLRGNARYEGYVVDLLEKVRSLINFKYQIYLTPDNKFGSPDDDGNWDGMVRQLMIGNASMSVAPLIISSARESVIDFTKPFKSCDMNVLIARPEEKSNLLQFLTPLHFTVWVLILVAVAVLSVVLTLIDRLNPNDEFDAEQPRYSFSESLWFFYASLVQAGADSTPQVLSGRILSSAWWFFSLIIISSYTANMAAFLTMSQISTPITGIVSLKDQNEVDYGTTKGSRAADFFQRSNRETFQNMWLAMSAGYMVGNTEEAIEKVINESYAFIWDAPVNNYIATYNCKTMAVGGPFNRQGYGIGVPRGSPYRDVLTIALLKLNEDGTLLHLEQKYWGTSKCTSLEEEAQSSDTAELEIENVGGIFIILSCGILIALIVCAIQYFWRKRKQDSGSAQPKGATIEDKWNELQRMRENKEGSPET